MWGGWEGEELCVMWWVGGGGALCCVWWVGRGGALCCVGWVGRGGALCNVVGGRGRSLVLCVVSVNTSANTETWELEKDLEVSSSEELSPGSVPEPTPCIANVESERVRTDTDEDEEVEGGHGAKVKLHGGQLHVEGWETEEEVIKASPICDVDGWLFPCSWEVLPSLEDLEDDLSVGEEAVNMLNRKHVMKHKPTLQGAHGVGNTLPPHLGEQESFSLVVSISKRLLEGHKISGPVQKFGIGEHGPLYLPALERSKKKLSKHRRKRELDISEIEPIGKESKKVQLCVCTISG